MTDGPRKIVRKLLERDVESRCKEWARGRGWWVRKFASPANRSVPDDVFGKEGRVIWVEFKRPGEKPTELQVEEHAKMRAAGLDVRVFDSVESFKQAFELIETVIRGEWL